MQAKVTVIGAAIMDLMGFPNLTLISNDSVPGQLKMAPGGVGRNAAENLARLQIPTRLITVFGDDAFGETMMEQAKSIGLDINHCLRLSNTTSATHLAILNHHHDLAAGIAFLDPMNALTPDFLENKIEALEQQEIVILETNIPQKTIEYLSKTLKNPRLFLDPVSIPLSTKVTSLLGEFDTLKANKIEAAAMTGIKLNDSHDLQQAAITLHRAGLKNVFITLGHEGVFYSNGYSFGQLSLPFQTAPANTTGAGDAFMAGLVYAALRNQPIRDCALAGMAAAQIAVRHTDAVNPALTNLELEKEMSNLNKR